MTHVNAKSKIPMYPYENFKYFFINSLTVLLFSDPWRAGVWGVVGECRWWCHCHLHLLAPLCHPPSCHRGGFAQPGVYVC